MLAAAGPVLAHELHEGLLVFGPVANGVAIEVEEPAEEHPVAELGAEAQCGLKPLQLLKEDRVEVRLSLALGNDRADLSNGLIYSRSLGVRNRVNVG